MRTAYRPGWSMTTILIVTLIVCYLAQLIIEGIRPEWLGYLVLSRWGLEHWRVYELVTFQFMHGSWWHLISNLIALYFFGRPVETLLGKKPMLLFYLLGGTVGGLFQIALAFAYPSGFGGGVVGASAGVFALIAAFAVSAPNDPIMIFPLPISFPAKFLLIGAGVYAAISVLLPFISPRFNSGIAHAAHLGGMLTGIAWIRWGMSARSFSFWPWRRGERRRQSPARSFWKDPKKRSDELPSGEFISREVDPILEKISAHGIHSLTERERQILEAARNRMAKR